MSEWISRQETIDYVERIIYVDQYYHPYSKSRNVPLDEIIDRIKQVPAADVAPVRHGRWIKQNDRTKPLYGWNICSECGAVLGSVAPYCSECGAKMELGMIYPGMNAGK